MATISIAGRLVGDSQQPLVIPEIGINHGGDLAVAIAMVDAAIACGAEIIKHQTHIVDDEMTHHARQVIPGNAEQSIYDIMQQCALTEDEEFELKHYVEEKGLIYLSTPFSRAAVDRLQRMSVKAFKVGSGECNNYPLIRYIAAQGKPVILSTGMNDIASIAKSVAILEQYNVEYALLHCTNVYPTPYDQVRLGALQKLQEAFPKAVVGLSDHTVSNYTCLGAIALGASIVERHFTDHYNRSGPDIPCSMDASGLFDLLQGSEALWQAQGDRKGSVQAEQPTMEFAFASVVTTKAIQKGDVFSEDNIWVKRPGNGELSAEYYEAILGKTACEDIQADSQLKLGHIKHFVM